MFFSINNDLMAHSTSRTYFSSLTNAEKSHIRMIQGINGDTNRTHAAYSHIDYSHRLLNKPIFLGKDLSYANFESASLWRPNFINKDLSHANFKLIQSTCPDFYKAILIEACFVQAKATSADFRYTDVQSADFTNANLEDSYFHDIKNLETTIRNSTEKILFLTEKIKESEINLKATNALLESLK